MEMYLINFADAQFRPNQELAVQLAYNYGVQHIFPFTDTQFKTQYPEFYAENRPILEQPRGCGYWLWKPFLIRETLKMIPPGEALLYCDSGVLLVNSPTPLFSLALQHEQVFFNMPKHKNREWTKRDIFIRLHCDTEKHWDAPQVKAQCSLWKHCQSSVERLDEWLEYCKDPQLITDTPSFADNLPGFVENRHDQAILSVLVSKWQSEIFRDPTQEGMEFTALFPNSTYGMIFSAIGRKA